MEIKIGQDIRKFKTKDIGNFSFKEAGFLVAGVAVGFLVYKLTNSYEAAILPAGIIIAVGFIKPYGMSLISFIRTVVKEKMTIQCYINETDFEYNAEEFPELYGKDTLIPASWDVIQTNTAVKINKADKAHIIK